MVEGKQLADSERVLLIVRMYAEGGGQHHIPHIHVVYQGEEFQFDFDGNELNGRVLAPAKKKLLDAWLIIHHDDLTANWELLSSGEQSSRIEPLR